jgi:hypothetical protein
LLKVAGRALALKCVGIEQHPNPNQKESPMTIDSFDDMFLSKYLKASDFVNGPRTLTIAMYSNEEMADGEVVPVVHFAGEAKTLVLNKTNRNTLKEIFNTPANSIGKKIVAYSASTDFQGRAVPCIRLRASVAPPSSASIGPPRSRRTPALSHRRT